jgi:hypothetical protein
VHEYNFDHPSAMDQEAILQCLLNLKNRRKVEVPIYDFVTHRRARADAGACAERALTRAHAQSAGEDPDSVPGGCHHIRGHPDAGDG